MTIESAVLQELYKTSIGQNAREICSKLQKKGFEAVWAGGAVRDLLMQKIPDDIDISTNALPSDVRELFADVITEYQSDIGTIIINVNGIAYEVTTFRIEEHQAESRIPSKVQFTTMEQDAIRRDFTINALYFDPVSETIFDYMNGLADLNEKIIKFIGDPAIRIQEDPLRMLRAIRFKSMINGQFNPVTFKQIHTNSSLVQKVSGFRQASELEKLLQLKNAAMALEDLWETDVLEYMIPELHACKGVGQPQKHHQEGDVWNHTLACCTNFKPEHSADVRLASLFHDIGKVKTYSIDANRIHFNNHASASGELTKQILERLSFGKKRIQKICWLVKHHMMMNDLLEMNTHRKSHWYHHQWFSELLMVFWLDIAGTTPSNFSLYETIVIDYQKFLADHPAPPKLLLTGNDIMKLLQIEPGEIIREIQADLLSQQLQKSITTKKAAIEYIQSKKDDYTSNTSAGISPG